MNPDLVKSITNLTHPTGQSALPGWCSTEKALLMAELVLTEKPGLLVELGVFGGRSFVPLALAVAELSKGSILKRLAVGIDPWSNAVAIEGMDPTDANDARNIDYWAKVPMADVLRRCSNALDAMKLWGTTALLHGRAEELHVMFGTETIDFLHIDDNHHTAKRTVELWLPRCRAGAIIVFDDANWAETAPGLEALERFADLVADKGNYRVYRKHHAVARA
jgi:predicted O-methyltransferase YrrM